MVTIVPKVPNVYKQERKIVIQQEQQNVLEHVSSMVRNVRSLPGSGEIRLPEFCVGAALLDENQV